MKKEKIVISLKQEQIKYEIIIGQNLLSNFFNYLKSFKNISQYVIITDNNVKNLYGMQLLKHLKNKGFKTDLLSVASGEQSKSQNIKAKLDHQMLAKTYGRDTLIIALGGGVVGDLAGFVAATYMRGIPFIQVPTTMLAMSDSSVGGKVGINTPYGKNLIGAFKQPKKVIADINCIKTLPQSEFINGLIEAIKMFLTNDKTMVEFCVKNIDKILKKDATILQKIITSAVKIKADIVTKDEWEDNDRMILNFGHTIGHAIETLSNYKIMHGYAVALGILVETKISENLKILTSDNYKLIQSMIIRLGINKNDIQKYKAEDIIKLIKLDKKARNKKAQFILLSKIGKVYKKNGSVSHFVEDRIIKKSFII